MLKFREISYLLRKHRNFSVTSISFCDPPQRFNQDVPSFKPLSESRQKKIEDDKRKLIWRVKPMKQPFVTKSALSVFDQDPAEDGEKVPNTLTYLTKPIDFSFSGFKNWFKRQQKQKEIFLQQFIPERHAILGNDLAAAHFILFRKGKVRFVGQKDWMEMNPNEDYNVPLPNKYDPNYLLEAIKCDRMLLYYEGLENIRRLRKLLYLSFKFVENFDDWCLDRVSGSEFTSLEELDISETKVTSNGLQALYRIPTLKKLIVTPPTEDNIEWNLTIAMLQDIMPDLEVISSNEIA
ncbi:hypothetical protein PVAND_004900 [Polypedilum vanderplanki]|uniref:Mitochondrial ATP synthase regulatory component factor B n=1 Tax=Polypedilum vanderplanki TaxID=319348 RepID=A0A9J6BYJ0_POLVA|nr:hypothetical protein PVAND_004900 [Polypedilum vanderplanki]